MTEILHSRVEDLPQKRKAEHEGYEYVRRDFVPRFTAKQCVAAVYEVPPGKSAYPYHYHTANEEIFYIISGEGVLRTPDGERRVAAGELLFFPADERGAHKLTNASETETLVYLDVDTVNPLDVSAYPDSGKIGVWGMGVNKVFRADDAVDYYDGE